MRRSARSSPPRTCRRRSARTRRASTSRRCSAAPLGGVLYAVTRWLPFAVDAVAFAVSLVLLGRIRTDLARPRRTGPPRGPRARRRRGHPLHPGAAVLPRAAGLVARWPTSLVNALFFVAILRLVAGGVPAPCRSAWSRPRPASAGILGALAAPWIIERVPTGALDVAAAWSVRPARWCRWRCGTIPPWWRPRLRLGCCSTRPATPASAPTGSRHPRRTAGPGAVHDAVRVDVGDAAVPRAGRRAAAPPRRRRRDRGARRADRAGRADPHAEPLGAVGAPPGRVARRRRHPPPCRQAAWTPTSPAAPPARSRPCTR